MKKAFFLMSMSLVVFVFQFCESTKKSTAAVAVKKPVTYVADVKPLIVANCSPCHIPPQGFKKALDTYESANSSIDDIVTRINLHPGEKGFMPFKHDRLSDSVIAVFTQWKADGLLEK